MVGIKILGTIADHLILIHDAIAGTYRCSCCAVETRKPMLAIWYQADDGRIYCPPCQFPVGQDAYKLQFRLLPPNHYLDIRFWLLGRWQMLMHIHRWEWDDELDSYQCDQCWGMSKSNFPWQPRIYG